MYVIVPLSQVIMVENDSDRVQEYYEEAPPPPVKKKKRGPTKLSKVIALTVEHKKKNHLELNEKNSVVNKQCFYLEVDKLFRNN